MISCSRTGDKVLAEMVHNITEKGNEIYLFGAILRDTNEAIKHFSLETVWLELIKHMPTLTKLLIGLLPTANSEKNKHLIS